MLMKKTIALIGTSALLLFLGFAPPSYAQEQHDDQGKPESAPPKTPNDKPKPDKEKKAKPPKQQPKAEQPKTERQSQQAVKQDEQQQKDQQKAQKDQEKAQEKNQTEQQKTVKKNDEKHQRQYAQQQNGREGTEHSNGGGRGRIPDDRFKAHFGREHHFHIGHPEIVEGHPHFSYGGYSFIIVQAWPADWGYDHDVYVIDDGSVYYLCDVAHPGVQLELTVVL
jgi:flagellar motor protein MotB